MTVILAPDFETPVVGMELSYKVGFSDEPDGRPGLASVAQSLMLRRTHDHVRSGEYGQLLRGVGGHWTWQTGIDRSSFSATVPSDAIALPLWLWSNQMGFLADTLTEERIAQQVVEIDDDYAWRFEVATRAHVAVVDQAVYPPSHPYHHAANRPGQALRGLTVAEVRAFLERYYTPAQGSVGGFRRLRSDTGTLPGDAVLRHNTRWSGWLASKR